jgi:DNA-binding HxlR family transcriptional regulator
MANNEERLPTWCGEDDWCPMVAASTILGRKWHPVIMHRLLEHGPLGFGELKERVHGISGKVLSESLTDLEEKGLVERTVVDMKPVRVEYSLTYHGRGLEEAVDELHRWGHEYLKGATDPEASII